MTSPPTDKQDLRGQFLAAARALFEETKDGAEIYHLIHEVVHRSKPYMAPYSSASGRSTVMSTSPLPHNPKINTPKSKPANAATAARSQPHTPKTKPANAATFSSSYPHTPKTKPANTPTTSRPASSRPGIHHATPPDNTTPEAEMDDMETLLNLHFPVSSSKSSSKKRPSPFHYSDNESPTAKVHKNKGEMKKQQEKKIPQKTLKEKNKKMREE